MDPLDLLKLIPDDIKTGMRDKLVEFVYDQAKKHLGDEIANKLKKLRSDAGFNKKFEQGLQRAIERFVAEYQLEDEDLVAAIAENKEFFLNEEIQAALLKVIKNPGAYLDEEHEIVIQSFASVLPERLNRTRVDRAVGYLLQCLAQEVWALPELQPIYSLQFQRMTAEATREQVTLQKAQLRAIKKMDAGIKDALLKLTDAMEQKLLTAPPLPALPAPTPKPYHNLPRPDYDHFVGRETELAWLRQALHPVDRAWLVTITGIGGVGKSALALAIAHEYCEKYDELLPEERFDAIIWISAKEEVLTAQGRELANLPENVLRTLEDVYTVIARVLQREDITRALPEDQSYVVTRALKEQRTLLIMDNLESVQDERVKAFLQNLPAPTKALITSREWLDVAKVWILKGLPAEDADQLISEEARQRQVSLDTAQRQRIYDLTSGLPLPIKLAIARISGGESFFSIERWLGDATGDLPEYCIAGQAELVKRRDPNAWKLLVACSLFDRTTGASREALGYVADLSLADRDGGLAFLQRYFLINCTSADRYWTLPIVQRFAAAHLPFYEGETVLLDRWLSWLIQFVESNGVDFRLQVEYIPKFAQEYANIIYAIRWCREERRWQSLLKLAKGTWLYFYVAGLMMDWEETAQSALLAVDNSGLTAYVGQIEVQIARVARLKGDYTTAVDHARKAIDYATQFRDEFVLTEALIIQSNSFHLLGELETSENLAKEMVARGELTGNDLLKWYGLYRLSSIATTRKQYNQALVFLQLAEDISNVMQSPRFQRSILYRRGSTLTQMGKYEDAEKSILQAMELDAKWGELPHIAQDKEILSQIYAHTNRLAASRQLAEESLTLYQRLGVKPVDAQQLELLALGKQLKE